MVAKTAARAFVGPLFTPEWITTSVAYPKGLFYAIAPINFCPDKLQFLVKYMIPSMRSSWKYVDAAARVVKESLSHPSAGDAAHGVNGMLPEDKKKDYHLQGRAQLGLGIAAIRTTVRVICQVLFDLAEHPEYIPILRAELHGVAKFRDYSTWTVENLASLKKMDSFMKESMRLNGSGVSECPFPLTSRPKS